MLELPPKQAGGSGSGTLVTFAYTAQCFPEPCAQQNSAGFTSASLLTKPSLPTLSQSSDHNSSVRSQQA